VSELSNSDSDVTVQDEDDVNADVAAGDEEAEFAAAVGLGSAESQGEGQAVNSGGPRFERLPGDVTVSSGRTLRCECVVAGDQPIGPFTFHRSTRSSATAEGPRDALR